MLNEKNEKERRDMSEKQKNRQHVVNDFAYCRISLYLSNLAE